MDELKNKVYELEGLLELLSHRPDKQTDLFPLIGRRVDEITRLWSRLNTKEPNTSDAVNVPADLTIPKDLKVLNDPKDPKDLNDPKDLKDLNDPKDLKDPKDLNDPKDPKDPKDLKDPNDLKDLKDLNDPHAFNGSDNSVYSGYSDSADFAAPAPRKTPALCLNDRFRFTRVLAGNDRNRFDAILEKLAQLPDYEAARDYLIEECNADIDDPEVIDFLDILQNYYE